MQNCPLAAIYPIVSLDAIHDMVELVLSQKRLTHIVVTGKISHESMRLNVHDDCRTSLEMTWH